MLRLLLLASILFPGVKPKPLQENPVVLLGEFREVQTCGTMAYPIPTNSPHPIMRPRAVAKIDFIIGYDGRVYSPFFLVSYNINEREVMNVVKSYRFHPMTCNGVPVDSEGIVTLGTP